MVEKKSFVDSSSQSKEKKSSPFSLVFPDSVNSESEMEAGNAVANEAILYPKKGEGQRSVSLATALLLLRYQDSPHFNIPSQGNGYHIDLNAIRESHLPNLYSQEWEIELANIKAYLESETKAVDKDAEAFVNNDEISPFTRSIFIYSSFVTAEKVIPGLSEIEKLVVIYELEKYVRPKHNFSGRLWMERAILKLIAGES